MTSNGSTGSTSGTPTKDKSKNRGEVDLSNSGRGVWLVKVPKYISDRWEKAPANTEVGKLKIKKKVGGAKPDVKFTLSDNICAPVAGLSERDKLELIRNSSTAKQIPKEHMFKVSNIERQKLGVFSCATTPEGDKLSLEGKVVQRAECCPISDNLYNMIKKDALQKAGEPRRMLKQLDKHVTTTFKPVSIHESSLKYERQKKVEGKKMRDDKDKVQEIIFALFEKHQYYNIKDLERETRQPIAYLKEILKEVCNYSVKPPHRNMWELKPEYRHYKQEQAEPEKKKKKEDSDSDSD